MLVVVPDFILSMGALNNFIDLPLKKKRKKVEQSFRFCSESSFIPP